MRRNLQNLGCLFHAEAAKTSQLNHPCFPRIYSIQRVERFVDGNDLPISAPASNFRSIFSDWGNILHNTTIATAIADRLVENSEIFLLGGDSVRKLKHSSPPAEPATK